MPKGFIFNHNKCVGCGACSAACVLENDWAFHPRNIYCYNTETITTLPLINLSIACNHCEKPVCLEGCPAGSYYTEPITGAIVIEEDKCIGCKYCQWNCPYDAPKFNIEKRVIGKCNLCYTGLKEGRLPACASGCPTGALMYGEMNQNRNNGFFSWFPEKNLNPGIEFCGPNSSIPLKVIPEQTFNNNIPDNKVLVNKKLIISEWSLIAFSFLSTLSVSGFVSSLIKGNFPDPRLLLLLIMLAAVTSIFHLGKKLRAWRAVSNLRSSPLSREIVAFAVYSLLSVASVILNLPSFMVAASISGLILLITVDSVYTYADNRKVLLFHSGQTFISSLLIIAFITESIFPFIFIASLKMASSIYNISVNRKTGVNFVFRFFRLALLVIIIASVLEGQSAGDEVIFFLFLFGELLDRVTFYIDFEPVNINNSINNHLTIAKNEKKRG